MAINYQLIMDMFVSPIMWLLIIIGMVIVGVSLLYIRKKRKLEYHCEIWSIVGNKKIMITPTRAGWFKEKMLFKIWDYGKEESIRTADGREIQGLTRADMHFYKGNRAIICYEKGDDRKVLVPIEKFDIDPEGKRAILEIAPASFRDVSSKIIESNNDELMSKLSKYAPYVVLAGIIVFALVSIIIIVQMVKNGQAESKDLLIQVAKFGCKGASDALSSGVGASAP